MATQTPKPASLFPDLPRDKTLVGKDGVMSETWQLYFDQLSLAMQSVFTPEGFKMPSQSASNITLLTSSASLANILYDSTNNVFKGNILTAPNTYTWKTFAMS